MPKTKKKFIDKQNSVTFRLVHRSQHDPLVADENAPQRVLQRIDDSSKKEREKRIEEQHKYGIYFDDDYDYLQHLRDVEKKMEWEEVERIQATKPKTDEKKIMLPSSVFASEVEEDVGLLNKAAPQSGLRLDIDPDIVAALDDDFDFSDPDNELEDNFIELANAECSDIEEEGSDVEYSSDGSFGGSDDENEEDSNQRGVRFAGTANTAKSEGKKSVFSQYSHSSYNPNRPELLKLLDARFEAFMEKNYREDQIGSLPHEEVEGHIDPNGEYMQQIAEEFYRSQQRENLPEQDPMLKKRILERAKNLSTKPEEFEYIKIKQKLPFDVESFHSTSSNLYNRPKLIELPSLRKKKKEPNPDLEPCKEESESSSDEESDTESIISDISRLSMRPKGETPEERRERKKNFKNMKRERRKEKKVTKQTFKNREMHEAQIELNNAKVGGKNLV